MLEGLCSKLEIVTIHDVRQIVVFESFSKSDIFEIVGGLAFIWLNLDQSMDAGLHRTTEILHIMSALIHYTIAYCHEDDVALIEYAALVVKVVNWPEHWKRKTWGDFLKRFPQKAHEWGEYIGRGWQSPEQLPQLKRELLSHKMTIQISLTSQPEASVEFFDVHSRRLTWILENADGLVKHAFGQVGFTYRKVTARAPAPPARPPRRA